MKPNIPIKAPAASLTLALLGSASQLQAAVGFADANQLQNGTHTDGSTGLTLTITNVGHYTGSTAATLTDTTSVAARINNSLGIDSTGSYRPSNNSPNPERFDNGPHEQDTTNGQQGVGGEYITFSFSGNGTITQFLFEGVGREVTGGIGGFEMFRLYKNNFATPIFSWIDSDTNDQNVITDGSGASDAYELAGGGSGNALGSLTELDNNDDTAALNISFTSSDTFRLQYWDWSDDMSGEIVDDGNGALLTQINFNNIPEPSAILLSALAGAGLLVRRKR